MKPSDITTLPEKYQRLKLAEIACWCWQPRVAYAGNRVRVWYLSYNFPHSLTKSQAIRYLASLDNGFVGQHFRLEE
jgi:hypothetical protein